MIVPLNAFNAVLFSASIGWDIRGDFLVFSSSVSFVSSVVKGFWFSAALRKPATKFGFR